MVLFDEGGDVAVLGEEGRAEEADGDGAREAEAHPEGGDAAGVRDHLDGAGGHEAHEDVRLAEVAQTPGEKADDAHEGVALEDVEHLDVDARDALGGGGEAAEVVHDGDRRHDQGEAHEESLNRVGPGDGEEAAHEDVADRGGGAQNEGRLIGHAEGVLEEAGARDHARGAVDREEEQDHDGGDDAQQVLLVLEAVREVVGERERVVGLLRVDAQAGGDDAPVDVGAEDEADADPRLGDAGEVDGAGQAHQKPAGHVGGADRKGRHEAAEATSAENVVAVAAGVVVGVEADAHHDEQIADEGDRSGIAEHKGDPFLY